MANGGKSPGKEASFAETRAEATVTAAETGGFGATTTAGRGARAVQQSLCNVLWPLEAAAQQLCAIFCAGCRQIPSGASIAPINRVATAARWKTPLNML
jgi:hypothetical protein